MAFFKLLFDRGGDKVAFCCIGLFRIGLLLLIVITKDLIAKMSCRIDHPRELITQDDDGGFFIRESCKGRIETMPFPKMIDYFFTVRQKL